MNTHANANDKENNREIEIEITVEELERLIAPSATVHVYFEDPNE